MPLASLVSGVARSALGATLGLGLVAAVAFQPAAAFAQTVAAAPAASATPQAAPGHGPALWVVRDADSTIYLFGTVHVLRPTTAWGSARVDRAFDSASDIWFEISNPDDQAAIIPLVQQYGVSPDRPLSSLLNESEYARLTAAAGTAGLPIAQLNVFRPWFAGLTLSLAPLVKAGYDPNSGVELILKARADAAGKRVHGFETIDQQVMLLANMSEADQLAFLRGALDTFDDATTDLDQLVEAWSTGDVGAIRRLGVDEVRDQGEGVYKALLADRNIGFATRIQHLLEGSGTAFVAVGGAHLAGPDSVQSVLESRGVHVEEAPQ